MASTADDVVYTMAQRSQDVEEYFNTKQWIWATDTNNRSYGGGQVSFELSQFANSGRWINYAEAYLSVPIVYGLKSSKDGAGQATVLQGALGLGLKNGFNQLVDSIEVLLNNVSVVQQTPYSNMFTGFKLLTSMSQDSLAKYSALLNFWPDDWRSQGYDVATGKYTSNANGVYCNNVVFAPSKYSGNATYPVSIANSGLLNRLYNLNFPVTNNAGASAVVVPWGFYSNLSTIGKANWRATGEASKLNTRYVQAIATIRLKDLSDFFQQLGLVRNAFIKININFNLGKCDVINKVGDAVKIVPNFTSRTNPMMMSSAVADSALNALFDVDDHTVTLGVGIGSLSFADNVTVSNSLLDACRVYAPSYQMLPDAESSFLEMHPTREIQYNDLFQYTISSVAPGAPFNQILSNGVIDPKYIVTLPILSASSNGASGASPILSPFASEPATTSAGMAVAQYQIQVSGKNLYQQSFSYDFENFLAEMIAINALDGAKIDSLTSGLVSFDMWQSCYRYYVSDLSRGSVVDSMVPKAVQISGINATSVAVDLFCFIVYGRKLVINTIDSEIISVQ